MKTHQVWLSFLGLLLLGSAIGLAMPFVTPDYWWNGAYMPWYVAWFTLPSDILFITICNICRIDWLSDLANKNQLTVVQAISSALVGAAYCGASFLVVKAIRRAKRGNLSR